MFATPILQDNHIYGVDSYGEFRCLEAATGDRVWEDQTLVPHDRWANIHMVRNADKVWMFTERGELIITRLSPKGVDVISRANGPRLELAIPRLSLGLKPDAPGIDFKWADNIQQTGEWSDFILNGDVAPNDRFNYRAGFHSATPKPGTAAR